MRKRMAPFVVVVADHNIITISSQSEGIDTCARIHFNQ
jgi:hypothetical protein